MGKKRIKVIAAIPAALVGIVCAGIGAAIGETETKKLILEKGGERLCSLRKKK